MLVGRGFTHGRLRAGGNGRHPRRLPRALGRASLTFSSRRPARPHVHPPGFAGANRRRPDGRFANAAVLSTSAPTVLPAAVPPQLARSFTQPCRRRCFLGGRRLSTLEVVPTPQPSEPSMVRSLKARGPSCLPPRAWRRSFRLLEAAALGRRRFAPPRRARSRAALPSLTRRREHCDPYSQQMP